MDVKDILNIDGFVVVSGNNTGIIRFLVPMDNETNITYFPETNPLPFLIGEIERWVKEEVYQVIITNSPFVVDAFDVFCVKHKKPVRFFLANEGLEEVTDCVSKIYDTILPALAKLKETRYDNENPIE